MGEVWSGTFEMGSEFFKSVFLEGITPAPFDQDAERNPMDEDLDGAVVEAAGMLRRMFVAWRGVGFTRLESLYLVACVVLQHPWCPEQQ